MYCVVIQNQYSVVMNTIQCDTLNDVALLLEDLEPDMDSEYLLSGEASTSTYGECTYSFRKLENSKDYVCSPV